MAAAPDRIAAFATAVGKPETEVRDALKGIIGDGPEAVTLLGDPTLANDEDLRNALVVNAPKIPLALFRRHLQILRGPQATSATSAPAANPTSTALNVLPVVPDDTSFLGMLRLGGVLKVDMNVVLAALKAAIADRLGLYDLPDLLVKEMEKFADQQEEPVSPKFFALRKQLTKRSYAEIFEAVEGLDGTYVTEARKKQLLTRIEPIWEALQTFHGKLAGWQQNWLGSMAGPGAIAMLIAGGRGGAGPAPAGLMAPPDTSGLRSSAEAVINVVNRAFAGAGIPVASALALDAMRIRQTLEEPTLPATIGASNREQMLRTLGVGVSSDIVRTEQTLTRYALGVMKLDSVLPGDDELYYLTALHQLGTSITWDSLAKISRPRPAGLGGRDRQTA